MLVPRPEARHYALRCRACNRVIEDDGFVLGCPAPHEPAFLVADYFNYHFQPDRSFADLFRFHSWLPIGRRMAGVGSGATYRSERLARAAGLGELWIAFNGWWPERGASLATATFKELEAWTVLARLPQRPAGTLVIASAGNTAAAFARACSIAEVACLIIVHTSGGDMLAVDNTAARQARALFEEHEGIDIDPAGAVALASLLQAARDGRIAKGATVLLNVTGGGRERRLREGSLRHARPDVRIARSEIRRSGVVEMVGAL